MKTKLFFVLLGALAFAACSTDSDEQSQQPPQKTTYPLTIEVTENPLIQDGAEGSNSNRAAITTNSDLNAFNLNYVYGSADPGSTSAERDEVSGKWKEKGDPAPGWPGTSETVNWYASTTGTFNLTDDASKLPYINFMVEESAANQKDLLVATASGTYTGTGGNLSFTFEHACAAVRFYVKKSTNLNSHTVSVSSIVLKNVVKQGKYFYGTKTWTLTDNHSNYTLLSSAKTLGSGTDDYELLNGSEDDSYLFLIPQALSAWNPTGALSNTYLELTCSINGAASQTAYVPFGATFAAGKKYDVKINIGKNSLYSGPDTKIIND